MALVIVLASFLGTLIPMPALMRRLRSRGLVVEDMYKPGRPQIVTHAGLGILAVAVVALSVAFAMDPAHYPLWPLRYPIGALLTAPAAAELALFTVCGYGIVGAIDDRHSLSHLVKAAVPLTLGIPSVVLASVPSRGGLSALITLSSPSFLGAPLLLWIVVPVYVLVASNLMNMHSGFNGLQSGLSLIVLATLIIRLGVGGLLDGNAFLLVVVGATAAFFPFNRNPARAIEGNVGSFLVGASIGVGIVTNGLFFAGMVMLAPHILDFLLFLFVKATGRPFIKFGTVRPDGTIQPPYPYKLKFLFPYYFRLTERNAVRLLWALTLATCLLSFAVPG